MKKLVVLFIIAVLVSLMAVATETTGAYFSPVPTSTPIPTAIRNPIYSTATPLPGPSDDGRGRGETQPSNPQPDNPPRTQ